MNILFCLIKEALKKEQHVYKLISIFLIYLNEIIPTSTFAGLIFLDKTIFLIFFEQRKFNSFKTTIKALDYTLTYELKNILAAYYNIIITYERYRLDIALNQTIDRVFLKNSQKSELLFFQLFSRIC